MAVRKTTYSGEMGAASFTPYRSSAGQAGPLSAERRVPAGGEGRVLVVAPEPFYEDRGTPIAVRNVLQALSELHYEVDLLTYPVGQPVSIPGLRIFRSPNPFRIRQVPVGFSGRKLLLDATLVPAIWRQLRRVRYSCIHAVEEAAFPAVVLGHLYGIPVIYDMQSSLPEQLLRYWAFRGRRLQAILRGASSGWCTGPTLWSAAQASCTRLPRPPREARARMALSKSAARNPGGNGHGIAS